MNTRPETAILERPAHKTHAWLVSGNVDLEGGSFAVPDKNGSLSLNCLHQQYCFC